MTRILIADPNPSSRNALALLLTRKLHVDEICQVADALSLAEEIVNCQPDILLLDVALPDLNLAEACFILRAGYPDLRIALLSMNEAVAEIANTCNAQIIHKGASVEQTVEQLRALIEDY